MLGKTIVYSLVVGLIAYEYHVYLKKEERTEIVNTLTGKLQGNFEVSRGGRIFATFRGIPYAKPPVRELRFAAPEPIESWSGVKIADNPDIECISREFIFDLGIVGQEDCLILNVFTPKDLKSLGERPAPKDLLPVVVYIHGGGFLSGSSQPFKADYFMDHDVILVTFNYRVGALGFLNLGDHNIRGNMGMKDQNLALKWISNNIKNFGGDPEKVTLMGESAGAASVHLHILSPMSAGLFQQAIMLSGHALVPWAFVSDTAQQAQRFGENLNCPTIMTSEFLNCLRSLDAEDIVKVHAVHRSSVVHPLENFGPSLESIVDDDTFLAASPLEILNSNNYSKVSVITGVNEGEGLLWVARAMLDTQEHENIRKNSGWYKALPQFLYLDDIPLEKLKKITKFYFNVETEDFDPIDRFENFTNLFTDRVFNTGLMQLARHQAANAAKNSDFPMYLYYYTYQSEFSFAEMTLSVPTQRIFPPVVHVAFRIVRDYLQRIIFGDKENKLPAGHADELALLFNIHPALSVQPSSRDFSMSEALVDTFCKFAKDGKKMAFRGKDWLPIGAEKNSPIQFMRLDIPDKSRMMETPFTERLNFWNDLSI